MAPAVQEGVCTSPFGETARFRVHDERGGREGGLRVYAGLRSDPFFIDLPAYLESLKTGRLAFKEQGQNSLADANVLGVVVEVDCGPLLQRTGRRCSAWSARRWSPASSRSASSGSAARRSRTSSCR